VQDFRDLKVWGKAHQVTLAVYRASEPFPPAERFGITSFGNARQHRRGLRPRQRCGLRAFQIALGSGSELEYFLLLARDLQFLAPPLHDQLVADTQEIKRMLTSLIARLKADS
jgi:hypothetical protein